MAAATASSKKLDAPISAEGQATLCFSPTARLSQYASPALKNTWMRMGTASKAMTSGWLRMAWPWKANSSTSVASSAPMDQGPMRASAASSAVAPRASRARRSAWAMATGITMYSTTEVSRVSHGTVMADTPSKNATSGAKASTMMLSFSATCDRVNSGSPPVRRLHTNTMAVHGAAASRMSPAM